MRAGCEHVQEKKWYLTSNTDCPANVEKVTRYLMIAGNSWKINTFREALTFELLILF